MILPSKKVLSIFVLVAALVASVIIAFGRDKASSAINYASNLMIGEKMSIPENPNWQSELGGIAPEAQSTETGEAAKNETVTDTVSRTLISNYLAMKESGSLDSESAQKLIDQTLEYIENTGVQNIQITELQLNVVADNGNISIAQYGENLGNIIKNKKPADIQKELGAMIQVIQSGDSSKSTELDGIIADYENIVAELTKMPVPKTFIKAHLDILNGARDIVAALKEARISYTDPFRGLSALRLYQEGINKVSGAMAATVSFITKNNIVYKQGSGGYYLLYGI